MGCGKCTSRQCHKPPHIGYPSHQQPSIRNAEEQRCVLRDPGPELQLTLSQIQDFAEAQAFSIASLYAPRPERVICEVQGFAIQHQKLKIVWKRMGRQSAVRSTVWQAAEFLTGDEMIT